MALAQGVPETTPQKPQPKNVVAELSDVQVPTPPPVAKPTATSKTKKTRPAAKPTPPPAPAAEEVTPPAPPVVPPPSGHAAPGENNTNPAPDESKEATSEAPKKSDPLSSADADADAKAAEALAAAETQAKAEALAKVEAAAKAAAAEAEIAAAKAAAEKIGMSVRVENLQTPKGEIRADQVKLSAPFAPKPFAPPPSGWKLESSNKVPSFKREVEISPGVRIKLDVHPHLLLPASEGNEAVGVNEPGFDPTQGYRQSATVGAILAQSLTQLERDSIALGDAIDRLQQVLVALPNDPTPAPEPEVTPPTPDPVVDALRPPSPRKPTTRR